MEEEEEQKEQESVVRDITFVSCGIKKFTYLNIPRQCPPPSNKGRLEEMQRVWN